MKTVTKNEQNQTKQINEEDEDKVRNRAKLSSDTIIKMAIE
jgi:hypothetical protein